MKKFLVVAIGLMVGQAALACPALQNHAPWSGVLNVLTQYTRGDIQCTPIIYEAEGALQGYEFNFIDGASRRCHYSHFIWPTTSSLDNVAKGINCN